MIQPGTYNATLVMPSIAEHLFTTANSGTDGFAMTFKLEDGETIPTTLWLSPKAYDRSLKTLKEVFGFDGDFNNLANTLKLPNYACKIVIEHEDFVLKDGTTRQTPKVKWINPRGAAPATVAGGVSGILARLAAMGKPVAAAAADSDGIPF